MKDEYKVEYDNTIKILYDEIHLWRSRYISSEMFDDSERAKNFFLIAPSSVFQDKTVEEYVEECRKAAKK